MKNNFYKIQADNGVVFYKDTMLDATNLVCHAFSTRIGGVSKNAYSFLNLGTTTDDEQKNVQKNFRLFSEATKIPVGCMVLSNQVHDDAIRIVTKEDCGKGILKKSDILRTDALITAEKNVALVTFYADCTPLLLLDTKKKVIASVHSGWRGTLLKIAQKTVLKMVNTFHSDPKDIVCAIGPSIKQCHFEVKRDVYDTFVLEFGDLAKQNTVQKGDKYYINTDALNKDMLLYSGIPQNNISVCPLCTYCNNDVFFSHRGDGGLTGRMCATIMLK